MVTNTRAALLSVILGCLACGGRAPLRTPPLPRLERQLPIRRVILYQNGVGYFEREGGIDENEITLHCRPDQINDLLKSLTVIDRGSGRAVSVSLPLERSGARLTQLPKQVRQAAGLLDILRVFRGARITVDGEEGDIEGRVVGVEEGLVAAGKEGPIKGWRLTLKTNGGDLAVYPLKSIRRVRLRDRALELGLDRSLDISLDSGAWKPVALTVRLAGSHSHQLMVSYIVEMPNWKPAYRLVLPSPGESAKPLLQGWAVVDNVSGESWRNVRLSLVAGTPMSFIYDLHTPRFTHRLDLTPRLARTALAPTREQVGYGNNKTDVAEDALAMPAEAARANLGSAAGPRPAMAAPRAKKEYRRRDDLARDRPGTRTAANAADLERQIETNVSGERVGGLFRYDLADPVTVPDSSSTLVSIVNARVSGGEIVLFRSDTDQHPYRAARLTNDSGFALEDGPVAIYAGGTFVGEGFVPQLEKGATTFLTFAVDEAVGIKRSSGSGQEVVKLLKISGGRILSETLQIQRQEYAIINRHPTAITAYVKSHAPAADYALRAAPANVVTAGNVRYLPLDVPSGAERKLMVEWVAPVKRWLGVDSSMAKTVLKMFSSSGAVPPALQPTLDQIVAGQQRLAEVDHEMSRLRQLKQELALDQERVRKNLDLLRKVNGNSALRSKLTRSLEQLEVKLSQLTAAYVKLDEEKSRLAGTIQALIGQIEIGEGTQIVAP